MDDYGNSGTEPLYAIPILNDDNEEPERGNTGRGRSRGRDRRPGGGRSRPPRGGRYDPGNDRTQTNQATDAYSSSNRGHGMSLSRGRGRWRRGEGRTHSSSRAYSADDRCPRTRFHSRDRDSRRNHGVSQADDDAEREENTRRPKYIKPMYYTRLLEYANPENDPDEILFKVTQSKSGFVELVSVSFEKNAFDIVRLIVLVSKAQNVSTLRNLLQKLTDMNFLHMVQTLLNKLVTKEKEVKYLWNDITTLETFGSNMCNFLVVLMGTMPSTLIDCLGVINNLKPVFQIYSLPCDLQEVESMFTKVNQEKQKAFSQKEARQERGYKKNQLHTEPPDDYRSISIFPTLLDIHMDEKPFLRANKTKGKYESLDTYLDIQFRLLREDYMQPLRNGILEYRACVKDGHNINRLRNIRVYKGVQIQRPKCSSMGINHILQFDNAPFKRMNWATSRRLLHGSLVCLSNDNFETVNYAIVADRNACQLSDGYIEVHFEDINGGIMDTQRNDMFVMAETNAYFEAYRYILEGLQQMKDDIPLSRYIIECKTDIQPPQYLLESRFPDYDFSCMLVKGHRGKTTYQVLDDKLWPKHTELGLDTSQYQALKTAVTKELAIIQGPPGTGKTYVGLKIAELMLANDMFWKTKENSSPILVVCYTNHALDQFLEGILKNSGSNEIVRIGGRCKNEMLEKCLLKNIKQCRREERSRTFAVLQRERDCRKDLRNSEQNILHIGSKLKESSIRIMKASQLKDVMCEAHYLALMDKDPETNKVCEWLDFHPIPEKMEENESRRTIFHIWKTFILEEIECMQSENRKAVEDVWSLPLELRAELYKCWHRECLVARSQHQNADLTSVEKSFEKRFFDLKDLQFHCTDYVSKLQLQQLLSGIQHKTRVLERWLCTIYNTEDIPRIREIIDKYSGQPADQNTPTTGDDDLEETRALDNDDDDVFYDYLKQNNSKTKATDGEWVSQWNTRKNAQNIKSLLRSADSISQEVIDGIENIWDISSKKRVSVYEQWLNSYRQKLKELVKSSEHAFTDATNALQEVRDQETLEILRESTVMGMTTTGAAKYRKLLERVKPQIIIVEEAAEVLESHIITTLNSNCKHLILIGDHKQLRPSTTVYELSKKYDMDISLFERMVRNNVPCVTLEEQHRMRPEISALVKREKLYPCLRDHESVKTYESIKGVDSNLFFIAHTEPELDSSETTSYSNLHEAKYIAKLCRYFLNQGYEKENITVLSPYMGQVMLLRKEMPKDVFDGVRITAVDNFQGEENDIILLSLVRSSENSFKKNPIGFVGIENRICVSLSRAKKGMYVIGNFDLIEKHSPLWEEIIREMRIEKAIADGLTLRCSNHPTRSISAKTAQDFNKVPEGGCDLLCGGTLPCSHPCPRPCHVVDMKHEFVTCYKPCDKLVCGLGHKCTKRCRQPCGDCLTKIEKQIPMCGHMATMPCHKDPHTWNCKEDCNATLDCGHRCPGTCGQCTKKGMHEVICKEDMWKKLPCGHSVPIKCHQRSDDVMCNKECKTVLTCGHQCIGTCGDCFGGKIHKQCKGTCRKILPCGHTCPYPCSEICPPCSQRCVWKCSHAKKCEKKCSEECVDCGETCKFRCRHMQCENPCHEKCEKSGCDKECTKKLDCTHRCQSLCGEICICVECNMNKLKGTERDVNESTRFMQLPDCKCIFEVDELDRHMDQATTVHRTLTKACPSCNKIIRTNIRRYSNLLKGIRQKIARCFAGLHKSNSDQKKINELNALFSSLEKEGLKKEYGDALRQSLATRSPGIVEASRKKYDMLKDLFRVETYIKRKKQDWLVDLSKLDNVMSIDQLQRAITLKDRKYITQQVWMDIACETRRLELAVKVLVLQEYMDKLQTGYSCKQLVYDTAKLLSLDLFDESRQKIIISAINLVTRYLQTDEKNTDMSLLVKQSEVQKEAARQPLQMVSNEEKMEVREQESLKGNISKQKQKKYQSEPGDCPNVEHTQEGPMIQGPKEKSLEQPRKKQAEARRTTSSDRSHDNYSDAIDDDACASDFTGTIEVRRSNWPINTRITHSAVLSTDSASLGSRNVDGIWIHESDKLDFAGAVDYKYTENITVKDEASEISTKSPSRGNDVQYVNNFDDESAVNAGSSQRKTGNINIFEEV